MNAWGSAGKKIVLVIPLATEGGTASPGCAMRPQITPAWEIARIKSFCTSYTSGVVPDFFDPVFQADAKAFIKAIGEHVAANQYKDNIIYVRAGLGLGGESQPIMPCYNPAKQGCSLSDYQTDKQQLISWWGYTPAAWEKLQENALEYCHSVFPWTTVIYPINRMFTPVNDSLNTNPATGNPVQMDVAYWATEHGFGVGQQGLAPTSDYTYANVNVILPHIIQTYPHTYIQFQTVWSLSRNVTPTCDATCVMQGDIATAKKYGSQTIEWYETDVINPANQAALQQWQQYVAATYGTVSSDGSGVR